MKGLNANNLCSHGGDMLAYLYDEMAVADRDTFEVHLADCAPCIDDFAELAQSRFPVYEWKRTEFDLLPTPRVAIPYEAAASVSWFGQLRRAFSFRPTLALGGLGAAMVVAVLTGYFILGGTSGDTEVAREVEPAASPIRVVVSMPSPSPSTDVRTDAPIAGAKSTVEPKAVQASTANGPTVRLPKPKPARQPKRNDPVPVMSSIDDYEDDSLRLADIFEEIGTSE